MARVAKVLKPLEVKALADTVKKHNVGGVDGTLLLVVSKTKAGNLARSWVFISRKSGLKFEGGLGSYTYTPKAGAVTLAEAREKARQIMEDLKTGRNPRARKAQAVPTKIVLTLDELFPRYFEYRVKEGKGWKSPRMLPDYQRLYQTYIAPELGQKAPDDVTAADVGRILSPVFVQSPSTGKKVQHLLSPFFRWCLRPENGYRAADLGNPATTEALEDRLPEKGQCKAEKHHAMCPVEDLPRFVRRLVSDGGLNNIGSMALLFIILTASRQGNVIKNSRAGGENHAEWKDIDLRRAMWTIPARKMKIEANGDHLVPLSTQALAVLQRLEALGLKNGAAVFCSLQGKIVGEGACARIIRKLSAVDLAEGGNGFIDPKESVVMTPHGAARSTFQTWAAERGFSYELSQAAIHHTFDKNDGSYLRTKLAEQRRPMMQAWGDYCLSECAPDWAEVKP